MHVAGHNLGSDGTAVLEHDARCPALLDDRLPDRGIELDFSVTLAGGLDIIRLKPAFELVARRLGEEIKQGSPARLGSSCR
jgi:hypothetical protein